MAHAVAPTAHQRNRARYAAILFALAVGGFAIGTSEFAMMGLMPSLVQDLGITEPQAATRWPTWRPHSRPTIT